MPPNAIRNALVCIALLALVACTSTQPDRHAPPGAQPPTPLDPLSALQGDYFAFDSRHTGRRHHVYVRLPESYGADPGAGYFVLWSALQAPDLFRGRIASNPAFTRTREALFEAPAAPASTQPRLVIASGARDLPLRVRNAHDWFAFWQVRDDRPWALRLVDLPDGTHAASIGDAYRQSMTWLFRDDIAAARTAARTADD